MYHYTYHEFNSYSEDKNIIFNRSNYRRNLMIQTITLLNKLSLFQANGIKIGPQHSPASGGQGNARNRQQSDAGGCCWKVSTYFPLYFYFFFASWWIRFKNCVPFLLFYIVCILQQSSLSYNMHEVVNHYGNRTCRLLIFVVSISIVVVVAGGIVERG